MTVTEEKSKIAASLARSDGDVGSVEMQIFQLTNRIQQLTEHLDMHDKDRHSRTGLLKMVGRRKKLLMYLKDNDLVAYEKVVKTLGLRG